MTIAVTHWRNEGDTVEQLVAKMDGAQSLPGATAGVPCFD